MTAHDASDNADAVVPVQPAGGSIWARTVLCSKCGRRGLRLRLDRKSRPFMSCQECSARLFAPRWSNDDVVRLFAVGLALELPQVQQEVARAMRLLSRVPADPAVNYQSERSARRQERARRLLGLDERELAVASGEDR